ncbi:hypothetical protein NLJ89_g9499 [Agrocybe chaxingu]|uniref:Uncharacterized protein n=1 Tax=Agrocybe chaxingu TaxID=84603 RepID=A0A9W8JT61_9AGAR|nr:hypothetical protein NLJ89_g9499 [Agrocybe chaxingu]
MFKKLIQRLKLRGEDEDTSCPGNGDVKERKQPRFDSSGLIVHEHLVKTKPARRFNSRRTYEWQLPLPYDILIIILDTCLVYDAHTIRVLSTTCASLSLVQLCRPLVFRTVTINTKSRKAPTSLEQFAVHLARYPHITDLVRELKIIDDGQMFKDSDSRQITSKRVVWSLMPMPIQRAMHIVFALPTLREVAFARMRIFTDILEHLSQISELEVQAEVMPSAHVDRPGSVCAPECLRLDDLTGKALANLFNENSPLKVARLKKMEAYMSGISVLHLSIPFSPLRLDLGPLILLQDLLLTCDLHSTDFGYTIAPNVSKQFVWLVNTLSSLGPRPRPISDLSCITLLVRHKLERFNLSPKVPWENLDAVFGPVEEFRERWPRLGPGSVVMRHVAEGTDAERCYVPGEIERMIEPLMPILSGFGVLKLQTAFGKLDFWGS